jgi:hypothetical protein
MPTLGTYEQDNLFAGGVQNVVTDSVTLQVGLSYLRGSVLGKILKAIGVITKGATNTGDATIDSATLAVHSQKGEYIIECTKAPSAAGANNAVFSVLSPDGSRLADATQGVQYDAGHLVFTIGNATSTDSAVGDTFTIAVIDGTKEAKLVDSASGDGSEYPAVILAEDVDATAGTKPAAVYLTGEFNENALAFGGTDTAATHKTALREVGIFLKTNQEA